MPASAAFAAALLDPSIPCPAGLVAWNGSDPTRRLAVYRNNVVGSLVDALADSFPVVGQVVGEAFFRAMAAVFVRQSPPVSPILAHYGGGFADFIEAFAPVAGLPYLADLARLEFGRVRAYHAADADPVSEDAIAEAIALGELDGDLWISLHPSASLLRSPHAVVSIWHAHQAPDRLEDIDPSEAEAALVLRVAADVVVVPLVTGAEFVDAVLHGASVAVAARRASTAEAGFDLPVVLGLLLTQGAICAVRPCAAPASAASAVDRRSPRAG